MNTKDIYDTAGAFNARNQWDCDAALALAREVLTDCNAHSEVRLLDAAPDLLAALVGILDFVISESPEQGTAIQKAQAAVAKAKGEL